MRPAEPAVLSLAGIGRMLTFSGKMEVRCCSEYGYKQKLSTACPF